MRVLVTGCNGLLGQKLAGLLSREPDVELLVTNRGQARGDVGKLNFMSLDVTNEEEVKRTIAQSKPEVVIHTAAMTQVDQCETDRENCWLNNVTAVHYVAKASEDVAAQLIHLSTDFVFDGTSGPLDETAQPGPISYYGESKLASEQAVQNLRTPWTIIRTVLVYGLTPDMGRQNIVLWVKTSLEEGKTIRVVNDQWRTPTLAEDLAMGCWLAAKKKATGIFHVSGPEMMTPYQIAKRTADHFGLDKGLVQETNSREFKQPARRPARTGFIIEKAKRELGYKPHNFGEGLKVISSQLK